jgi:hypothetical protein
MAARKKSAKAKGTSRGVMNATMGRGSKNSKARGDSAIRRSKAAPEAITAPGNTVPYKIQAAYRLGR